MWTNGDDFNDDGERIRLYQPIAYSSGRGQYFSPLDATVSHVGGGAAPDGACPICHAPLLQLTQLHVPHRRITHSIWGCNRAKCVNSLFQVSTQFSMGGGGGVFYAQRRRILDEEMILTQPPPTPPPTPAPTPPPTLPTKNDWALDSDDDDEMDLEQQVAAMELRVVNNDSKSKSHKKKPKQPSTANHNHNKSKPAWPCLELHSVLEPPGPPTRDDQDEEDRIGSTVSSSSSSDAKIRQMLAKYLAEEEDPEILAALRGTATAGGGGNHRSREKDERLKASDRALWTFTDRIKRSPRQVLRYAPNGTPLWSIPRPTLSSAKPKGKKSKVKFAPASEEEENAVHGSMIIPPCGCGSPRRFEFQLMPSLLHVLEVDKYATKDGAMEEEEEDLDAIMSADHGGMNWGAIAVYTCPRDDCPQSLDYLVVQASVDETPRKRAVAPSDAPVFIRDDQTFDALCDDGDGLEGRNDDDDDDDDDTVMTESDLVFTLDG